MPDDDGEYIYDTTDQERARVLDEVQTKRKGIWINRSKFIALDSGRRVYTTEISIHGSDDFDALLKVDPADVLPCDTLLAGYKYFLTDLNTPGVYAVGSMALAKKVLGMDLSGYDERALRQDIANRSSMRGWTTVSPTCISLAARMTGRRRGCKDMMNITALGALAHMSDVRDIVRNRDLLLPGVKAEVTGDADIVAAIELEPNLASNERCVLRYLTRKPPPDGYAPNLNKPVTALAYTQSLKGDPSHIANAMGTVMRAACADELEDMPRSVSLGKCSDDDHWLFSYAKIVMWWRRLKKLPATMRDPVVLLLPGAGHKDRTGVAIAVANHSLHLAPVIRKEFSHMNGFVFVLTLSMLWRILNVPKYAEWRKMHAEVLGRSRLPQDAAARVIASEFCAYRPRIAGGAVAAVNRLCGGDYAGYDMTKAKADAVAFLMKYAPKGSSVRGP